MKSYVLQSSELYISPLYIMSKGAFMEKLQYLPFKPVTIYVVALSEEATVMFYKYP